MKNLLLLAGLFSVVFGATMAPAAMAADPARFGDDKDTCSSRFLTFPTWYRGLPQGIDCSVAFPSGETDKQSGGAADLNGFIFTIILNIIEIGLQLVAYAAVGYVIYGGFKYLTAAGDPSRITAGRKIITNALIGLVLSFMSVAIVNLIASNLK